MEYRSIFQEKKKAPTAFLVEGTGIFMAAGPNLVQIVILVLSLELSKHQPMAKGNQKWYKFRITIEDFCHRNLNDAATANDDGLTKPATGSGTGRS
jgi:hypothetical protein